MRKVVPYVIVVVIGLIGYYFFSRAKCSKYSCISFDDMEQYRVEEEYENSPQMYRAMVRNGNTRIRIEEYTNTSKEEAISYDKIKIMNIESLYETAKSPYPGALSNEIECGTEYRPHVEKISVNTVPMTHVRGYLNERFQLGSCIKEELQYRSDLVLFHCGSQKIWYQFEVITPLNETEKYKGIISSLRCD